MNNEVTYLVLSPNFNGFTKSPNNPPVPSQKEIETALARMNERTVAALLMSLLDVRNTYRTRTYPLPCPRFQLTNKQESYNLY